MFTHTQIWTALDRLAESRGLSASGLAKQAGLDPTAFNKSKRISPNGKPRWPSTESLSKVLTVTHCTMSDMLSMMDQGGEATRTVPLLAFNTVKAGKTKDKNKSILAVAFDIGDQSFAVTIEDNRLHPLFRNGSTIVADLGERIKKDDRILFYSKSKGLKGGILHSNDKKGMTILLPDNDFEETSFSDSDLEWTARILWASQ
jgi:phage repressor protein C with HTH and peptisase S24 domain